jgi:lycopene cyclase-like protein
MREYHYVWLFWSIGFLCPWIVLFLAMPDYRDVMWRTSLATSLFGATEPIFVPKYWNPPSLFDLAQRTGFDIESFIFCFAIGGIGVALYNSLTRQDLVPMSEAEKQHSLHRFHRIALLTPFVAFVPLYFLPWNPIYPAIACLVLGAIAAVICRPDLKWKTLIGGFLFLAFYAVLMLTLSFSAPGYIEQVWSLPALSGMLVYGIPLEELLFGFAFGLYWTGVYEHFTWKKSVIHPGGNEAEASR